MTLLARVAQRIAQELNSVPRPEWLAGEWVASSVDLLVGPDDFDLCGQRVIYGPSRGVPADHLEEAAIYARKCDAALERLDDLVLVGAGDIDRVLTWSEDVLERRIFNTPSPKEVRAALLRLQSAVSTESGPVADES